jgi:hypothetical protein
MKKTKTKKNLRERIGEKNRLNTTPRLKPMKTAGKWRENGGKMV